MKRYLLLMVLFAVFSMVGFAPATVLAAKDPVANQVIETIHLNQATADAAGRPVVVGPAEATATGNLLLQGISSGQLDSLADARRLVARTVQPRRFEPAPTAAWQEAAARYREIEERYS